MEKLLGFDDSLNNRNERPQSLLWLPYFCDCSTVFPATEVRKLGKRLLRENDNEVCAWPNNWGQLRGMP